MGIDRRLERNHGLSCCYSASYLIGYLKKALGCSVGSASTVEGPAVATYMEASSLAHNSCGRCDLKL